MRLWMASQFRNDELLAVPKELPDTGSRLHWIVQCLLVALLYYVSGRLALLMAIPPGYAVAVWPAAGVALALTLAWGYRSVLGVVAASFLINVEPAFAAPDLAAALKSVVVALSIGIGAALQAAVAAFVVKRIAGYPRDSERDRDVL